MRLKRIVLAVALVIPLANALAYASAATDGGDAPPAAAAADRLAEAPEGTELAGAMEPGAVTLRYVDGSNHVFRHPGATFVKVHFEALRLAPGDFVTVADPAGDEKFTYHGDPTRQSAQERAGSGDSAFTVNGGKGFAAMSVEGDTAVVTLHSRPAGGRRAAGTVRVDKIFRGLSALEQSAANPKPEAICGADARRDRVCFRNTQPKEFRTSAAVGRLVIDGGILCTAFRVGSSNTLLTNNHCMSTPEQVRSAEVRFGFDCRTCGGKDPKRGVKVAGDQLIKTSARLDFTLFSVQDFESISQFGTLFMESRTPAEGENIYVPGHGDGLPLKIAIFSDQQDGAPCTIVKAVATRTDTAYDCDTSPGNSGSPIISEESNKVIGLHHRGGLCVNLGVRSSLVFEQIAGDIVNE
jgi:V8-like Glu-specific endopeptidase